MSWLVRWTGALVAGAVAAEAVWGDISLIGRFFYLYAAVNFFIGGLVLGLALEPPEDAFEEIVSHLRHPINRVP